MTSPRRSSRPAPTVVPKNQCYVLWFFVAENAYEVLSSSSSLIPSYINVNLLNFRDEVTFRGGIKAQFIARKSTQQELVPVQKKLEKKLTEKEGTNVTLSSTILFSDPEQIDPTLVEEQNEIQDTGTGRDQPSLEERTDEIQELSSSEDEFKRMPRPKKRKCNADEGEKRVDYVQEAILQALRVQNDYLKKSCGLQTEILKQLKKIRKSSKEAETADARVNPEPVVHENTDLARLGSNHLSLTGYALELARHLWTDSELMTHMIGKRRGSIGRAPVSPSRADIFTRAVRSRFRIGEEKEPLEEAYSAVNQLGNDIYLAKRLREGSDVEVYTTENGKKRARPRT